LIVAVLAVLLWQTPALAGLVITDRQQASTDLVAGPQFFELGSGEPVLVGVTTGWDGFDLDQLEIDDEGNLVLARAGDVEPSSLPWHDAGSTSRACEAVGDASVRSLRFDIASEVEAGRLRADMADVRVHHQVDGAAVSFRVELPTETDPGSVVVDADSAVCVYWGDPSAASLADPSVRGPVIPDGGWSWRVWNEVGDGRSLDLVDWSAPTVTSSVSEGSVPSTVCNQCASELTGFITPAVSGTYRLYLSADDVGRLEVAPADDPGALATVVELTDATPADVFSDPAQVSAPVELEIGQRYAIRARSKDLEFDDHLQVAFALEGEPPVILPAEAVSDEAGQAGTLTYRRFELVETADRTGPPDSTVRIEASQTDVDSCDECAHSISGHVVVAEAGTYRFWISSDDEGALRLSTAGDPSTAVRVAWLTNYTTVSSWTADPSQGSAPVELAAGQVIWLEAYSRDRGGPDHLQVGWSRVDGDPGADPGLIPAAQLSEAPPEEAPLPSSNLGPVEGRPATSGAFLSAPLDTTALGSNVFGRMFVDAVGEDQLSVVVEFADASSGPWRMATPALDRSVTPASADGLRWVRFRGTVSGTDTRLAAVGLERDLVEATSDDGTTTVTVPGTGDHVVLRVRGSIGSTGTASVGPSSTDGVTTWLLDAAETVPVESVGFDRADGHDIGVSVGSGIGPNSATSRWVATDGRGITVVHDLVVIVAGA
jgi:hypothetical protein